MAVEDSCIDNFQLIFDPTIVNFDEGTALCEDRHQGRLTIPRSIDWFSTMLAFHAQNGGAPAWVGLRDFEQEGGALNGRRFQNIKRETNPFTFLAGQDPWSSGAEPNDSRGVEDCGEARSGSGSLNDLPCSDRRGVLCEVYCGEVPQNFIFDECVGDVQLYFNPNRRTFDAANADCEAFDPEGKLAIPKDNAGFEAMQTLIRESGASTDVWVGLRDFAEVGGLSTERFLSVEGELLEFTNVGVRNFPWSGAEPNDNGGIQKCATIFRNNLLMDDNNCRTTLNSLCQRPCPLTLRPTSNPTELPTSNPTVKPTTNPTFSPTFTPVVGFLENTSLLVGVGVAGVFGICVLFVVLVALKNKADERRLARSSYLKEEKYVQVGRIASEI